MRYPATGRVTNGFSPDHQAVDLAPEGAAAAYGSPIFSPETGRVSFVGYMGTGVADAGLVVEVTADSGNKHRMCHNSNVLVNVGDHVAEGQHIAAMGNSGYVLPAPTPQNPKAGSHCHWVMFKNGARVDGRQYITNTPAPKPQQGDDEMLTREKIIKEYTVNRGLPPSESEIQAHLNGGTMTSLSFGFENERNAQREVERQKDVYIQALTNDLATIRRQADELAQRPTKQALSDLQANLKTCEAGAFDHLDHIQRLQQNVIDLTTTQRTELEKTFPQFFDKLNSIFKIIRQRFQK